MTTRKPTVNLRDLFLNLQDEMRTSLRTIRRAVAHPGTKGAATEKNWLKMLRDYLPDRYKVASAFVVDSGGHLSEQQDIVIFDHQYTPFLLKKDSVAYVPAESVYAVLEVKPTLSKASLAYAGKKIASVRRLHRTSAKIIHAGGITRPKQLHTIIGGLLTTDTAWKKNQRAHLTKELTATADERHIDLGCTLNAGAFTATYKRNVVDRLILSSHPDTALVDFFLGLVARLQTLGTVPAIDCLEYAKAIHK